jgi:hypothetical protein
MSNALKKGRELLKAARSQASLAKEDKIQDEKSTTEKINNEKEVKHHVIFAEDSQIIQEITEVSDDKQNNSTEVDLQHMIKIENKIETNHAPLEREMAKGINSRLAMFDTKNKLHDKPMIPKSLDKANIPISNKVNLLNRMNKDKDKEPIRMMGFKPEKENKEIIGLTDSLNTKEPNDTHEPSEGTHHVSFLPTPSKAEQEKLIKRIASAKGMAKGLTKDKVLAQKTSERIMGMASMLQNRIVNPVEQPKKKFLLNDDDIQQIDDEKKPETLEDKINMLRLNPMISLGSFPHHPILKHSSHEEAYTSHGFFSGKSFEDIMLEKPFNKNVKKKAKQEFILPEH